MYSSKSAPSTMPSTQNYVRFSSVIALHIKSSSRIGVSKSSKCHRVDTEIWLTACRTNLI